MSLSHFEVGEIPCKHELLAYASWGVLAVSVCGKEDHAKTVITKTSRVPNHTFPMLGSCQRILRTCIWAYSDLKYMSLPLEKRPNSVLHQYIGSFKDVICNMPHFGGA